ncbi:MAG: LapA family protein [Thermomicrobiales bacterium]
MAEAPRPTQTQTTATTRTPTPPPRPTFAERRHTVAQRARLIGQVTVGVLLLVFVLLNYDPVDVRLVFWEPRLRLAWALLGAAFLGFLFGVLVPRLPSRRR